MGRTLPGVPLRRLLAQSYGLTGRPEDQLLARRSPRLNFKEWRAFGAKPDEGAPGKAGAEIVDPVEAAIAQITGVR
jgi:hypothetical protein